jgi:hypothetical protein
VLVPVLVSERLLEVFFSLMIPLSVTKPVPFPVRVSVAALLKATLLMGFWMVKAPVLSWLIELVVVMSKRLPAMMSVTVAVLLRFTVLNRNVPMSFVEV